MACENEAAAYVAATAEYVVAAAELLAAQVAMDAAYSAYVQCLSQQSMSVPHDARTTRTGTNIRRMSAAVDKMRVDGNLRRR